MTDNTDTPFCEKCRFFDEVEPHTYGNCRRNPPVVIISDAAGRETVWPVAMSDDWCGEYRRKDFSA